MKELAQFLKKNNYEAYLVLSESSRSGDMYYLTNFLSESKFIYLIKENGKESIIVGEMEVERAKQEARIEEVKSTREYKNGSKKKEFHEIITNLLKREKIKRIAVDAEFPVYIADKLRENGFEVKPVKNLVKEIRAIKSEKEIENIKKALYYSECAMGLVCKVLERSKARKGLLYYNDKVLTSEYIRAIIRHFLTTNYCSSEEVIVACGAGSANPHWKGSGNLKENEPIIIDIWTRTLKERYYADFTRTFVKGELSSELKDRYEAVKEAQEKAFEVIKAGITGEAVHNAVCEVLEERGFSTLRDENKKNAEGFIHSTGHGVGLELHELPTLGEGGEELKEGNVVTVEPGLYYKNLGGVRIEDLVLVTKNGCKNLTSFEKYLKI